MADALTRFLFEYAPVRGGIVQLEETWQAIQSHADYPAPLKRVLGELLAAAALLTSNIKFEGSLVLQLHGDGPVRLIVVEVTSDRTLRATAKWTGEVPADTLAAMLGHGRFVMTLDQSKAGKQNYQGIVPLEGQTTAEVLAHYMQTSEQLDTRIFLAASDARVAGMMLQRMPDQQGMDHDAWNRATILADTLKPEELLQVPANDLLMRLFHEETLRRFEQEPLAFACSCSRDKVAGMLQSLGREEIDSILAEQGEVEIACDFCGHQYRFDAVDATQLFVDSMVPQPGETRH
ncbi:Hsp33 family molecular chaperone HslO [Betaproteobacteria bacterium SCN2]|jgi:molecular chaperone Hsp33|nr:Hsp33 family molecular chaperone HslO [Betaproteobacteria bacterium SCN2]